MSAAKTQIARTAPVAPARRHAVLPVEPSVRAVEAHEPDDFRSTLRAPHHSIAKIALTPPPKPPDTPAQKAIAIGSTTDPLEAESDRIAHHIQRSSNSSLPSFTAASAATPSHSRVPPSVPRVLAEPGNALDNASRSFMESRFGHSFANVRVHADDRAAASAANVSARAYTVGHHLVFGRNQFAPATDAGQNLLAHELTHVLQQQHSIPVLQRAPIKDQQWKRDVTAARYRGQLMARRLLNHGLLSSEARQKINEELDYFEGAAYDAYLAAVKPALVKVTSKPPAEIEMSGEEPVRIPKPIPLMLDPTDPSMCGGQKCFTDEDEKALREANKPQEDPARTKVIDEQVEELKKKTAEWGAYQAFAVSLLVMALREKDLHDPRAVAVAIQHPILSRYRAWLLAIDKARMDRWNSGKISKMEEIHLRGNGDMPDKSWFAKDGTRHGPYALEALQRSFRLDESADESSVDHVFYQVREFRQLTDPHEIEMAGLAADMVNAFVGLATGINESLNAAPEAAAADAVASKEATADAVQYPPDELAARRAANAAKNTPPSDPSQPNQTTGNRGAANDNTVTAANDNAVPDSNHQRTKMAVGDGPRGAGGNNNSPKTSPPKTSSSSGGANAAPKGSAPVREQDVWVQLEDGTVRAYRPKNVKARKMRPGADVTTKDGPGKIVKVGDEAPTSAQVRHDAGPPPRRPAYENPGHHDTSSGRFRGGGSKTTPLPPDAEAVYKDAIPADSSGDTWYGVNKNGDIYRYQTEGLDKAHFNASTNSERGLDVPAYIRNELEARAE